MANCACNPAVGPPIPPGSAPRDATQLESFRPGAIRLYGKPPVHFCLSALFSLHFPFPLSAAQEGDCKKVSEAVHQALQSQVMRDRFTQEFSDALGGIDNAKQMMASLGQIFDESSAAAVKNSVGLSVKNGQEVYYMPVDTGLREDRGEHMVSVGVIYGYAFEGHCYKLARPRIMFLPDSHTDIPVGDSCCDCGFDPKLGYAMWEIDKLERAVVLDVRTDGLQALVLDENRPGNRSPAAYAQAMALSPQRPADY